MKSWQIKQLAEPDEALKIEEVSLPSRNQNEVLINVKAFSINFFDILQCRGEYQELHDLPFTPGAEVAGIVEVGDENGYFSAGDYVIATPRLPNGGYAEYVSVSTEDVFTLPEHLTFEEATGIYITYHTAYYALENRADLKEEETLLVHAGSGGVGTAAIQLGKELGARVIATAGTEEKLEICTRLGADVVINYREHDFVQAVKNETDGKGADVIFDPVGGDILHRSRKCINFEGRLLLIGFAGGDIPEVPMNHVLIKNYSLVGVHFGYFRKLFPNKVKERHEKLMKLMKESNMHPEIYHYYSFHDVVNALNDLGSRKSWGKLIVQTDD